MSAKFVDTGARRYVVGEVEPFDQKNEMFCRPLWDEEMLDLGKKFYMTEVPPKDKPGYRLKDQSMVNAAWHLENIFAQGVAGGRMGMYAWDFCLKCEKCAAKCPSNSIAYGEPTDKPNNISNRQGVLRWPINAETCLTFWAGNGTDCSNCIRTCPFNKPPGLLHDSVRWGISNFPGLNPLFLWGDDLLGYGRKANPDSFWAE